MSNITDRIAAAVKMAMAQFGDEKPIDKVVKIICNDGEVAIFTEDGTLKIEVEPRADHYVTIDYDLEIFEEEEE